MKHLQKKKQKSHFPLLTLTENQLFIEKEKRKRKKVLEIVKNKM